MKESVHQILRTKGLPACRVWAEDLTVTNGQAAPETRRRSQSDQAPPAGASEAEGFCASPVPKGDDGAFAPFRATLTCTCNEAWKEECLFFTCLGCRRTVPSCYGSGDKYFDYCDDCAVYLMDKKEKMSKTNPNQDAYPGIKFFNEQPDSSSDGLTKREYFAAHALQGLLANSSFIENTEALGLAQLENQQVVGKYTANVAVIMADRLIESLNSRAPGGDR